MGSSARDDEIERFAIVLETVEIDPLARFEKVVKETDEI